VRSRATTGWDFADLRRDDAGSGKFQKSTLRDASHDSLRDCCVLELRVVVRWKYASSVAHLRALRCRLLTVRVDLHRRRRLTAGASSRVLPTGNADRQYAYSGQTAAARWWPFHRRYTRFLGMAFVGLGICYVSAQFELDADRPVGSSLATSLLGAQLRAKRDLPLKQRMSVRHKNSLSVQSVRFSKHFGLCLIGLCGSPETRHRHGPR